MYLSRAKSGKCVRILRIQGGKGLENKLHQYGLFEGDSVRVIRQAPIGGPVIIQFIGRKFALGRGVAAKIEVEEVPCG